MKPRVSPRVTKNFLLKGKHQGDLEDNEMGRLYAEDAIKIMDQAVTKGREVCCFILCFKKLAIPEADLEG